MTVVITCATESEIVLIKQLIENEYAPRNGEVTIVFHVSGVGILASCFSISKLVFEQRPDIIIQAGIAGTFDEKLSLGKVVAVRQEFVADAGVEENERFKDLFDLNLQNENLFPFSDKKLINAELGKLNYLNLDEVTGITVNEITTRAQRIKQYRAEYNAVIESMEGASLHYCCLQTATSFIQIRALSNYIGERDKSKWKLKESLKNLADTVFNYVDCL